MTLHCHAFRSTFAQCGHTGATFEIDGVPLFDACNEFLDKAGDLIRVAREIADQEHGTNALTLPPS
jgi:hypothetical protein